MLSNKMLSYVISMINNINHITFIIKILEKVKSHHLMDDDIHTSYMSENIVVEWAN